MILSAAIIRFVPEEKPSYDDLLKTALLVKFNARDQADRFKRTVTKSTLEWWEEQADWVRKFNVKPSPNDILAEDGLREIYKYMEKYPDHKTSTVWARGSLDQMAIDSLSRNCKMPSIAHYANWRDVRTAIDCLTGSTNGYCKVDYPGFESYNVIKHHPVHDCALDAMMLMCGK